MNSGAYDHEQEILLSDGIGLYIHSIDDVQKECSYISIDSGVEYETIHYKTVYTQITLGTWQPSFEL